MIKKWNRQFVNDAQSQKMVSDYPVGRRNHCEKEIRKQTVAVRGIGIFEEIWPVGAIERL
jgi:hypothetical protein